MQILSLMHLALLPEGAAHPWAYSCEASRSESSMASSLVLCSKT